MKTRHLLLILALTLWGGSVMANEVIERGIGFLTQCWQERGGKRLSGLETSLVLRTMQLSGRMSRTFTNGAEAPTGCVDLCHILEGLWNADPAKGHAATLVGEDGGWAAEQGGQSEFGTTVMGLGVLLDSPLAWQKSLVRLGMDYLVRRHCPEGRLGDYFQMDGTGVERAGRWEFFMFLCQLFRDGFLTSHEQEQQVLGICQLLIAEFWAGDFSAYRAGLLLRGMSLLGLENSRDSLAERLRAYQLENGCWAPEAGLSSVAVTCSALDGLLAARAGRRAIQSSVVLQSVDSEGTRQVVTDSLLGDVLTISSGEKESHAVQVTVYGKSGVVVESQSVCGVGTSIALWYREWKPGDYAVKIRHRSDSGGGLLADEALSLSVPVWGRIASLQLVRVSDEDLIRAGETVELAPLMLVQTQGNSCCQGMVTCSMTDIQGKHILDFGEQRFEHDPGKGSVEIAFPSSAFVFPESGHYVFKAVATTGNHVLENHRLIYVAGEYGLEIENRVVPSLMTVEPQQGRVHFVVSCHDERGSGIAAHIGSTVPEEVVVRDSPQAHDIMVSGIVDAQGRTVEKGWLVVRANFGGCSGGVPVGPPGRLGSLTAHDVEHGVCRFAYTPGHLDSTSVTALSVYGAYLYEGAIKRHNQIGSIELRLEVP